MNIFYVSGINIIIATWGTKIIGASSQIDMFMGKYTVIIILRLCLHTIMRWVQITL